MPRRWLLFLLGLLVAGCGPKVQQLGGMPPKEEDTMHKIVSLSPSTTEILGLTGNVGQLIGRTAACNYPTYVSQLAIFGSTKPDYERLAAAKPNLVVLDPTLYSKADEEKIKELGIKVMEIHANSLDEYVSQTQELARVIDAPEFISNYLDKVEDERVKAKATRPANGPTVAILSGSMWIGKESFLGDLVNEVGGHIVGPEGNIFVQMNPEALVQSNPEIVFIAVDLAPAGTDADTKRRLGAEAVSKFTSDPRYASLKAIKAAHVYPVDSDILLRQGSRVNSLIAAVSSVVQANGK